MFDRSVSRDFCLVLPLPWGFPVNLTDSARARSIRVKLGLPLRISVQGVDYGPVEGMQGIGGDLEGETLSVVGTTAQLLRVIDAAQAAGFTLDVRSSHVVRIGVNL